MPLPPDRSQPIICIPEPRLPEPRIQDPRIQDPRIQDPRIPGWATPESHTSAARRPEARRVCVVTTSYPSYEGDPAGHFVQAEVAELERAGREVSVIAPNAGGAFGWPGAAFRIRQRPWRALEAARWTFESAARVRRAAPELIIAHWSVPAAWPIVTASGLDNVPLEIVSHGGDVRMLRTLPEPIRIRLVDRLAKRATTWRFVSERLRRELFECVGTAQRARLERIAKVAASPLTMFDVGASARRHRETLGARTLYVCAGRLVPSKRVDKVIDYVASRRFEQRAMTAAENAARAIGPATISMENGAPAANGAPVKIDARPSDAGVSGERAAPVLVILGDGPERARLERVAARWQLDARFLGTVSRMETLAWIGAADELVQASLAEGLSTVLREAQALGVKVTVL